MNKNFKILWGAVIIPLLVAFFIFGCASRAEIKEFQYQMDSLSVTNQFQARNIARLDSLLEENIRLLRAIRAENTSNMGSLQEEMVIVESIMRDSGFKVNSLTDRIESLKNDIDKRTTVSMDSDSVAIEPVARGDELYSTALLDLNQGKYDLAVMGFESYLEQFKNGSRADDSRYNIGEALLAKANFMEAAISFLTVTRKWPESELVPSALYKAARCYEQLDQIDMASNYYNKIVESHKSTPEAELAKERLEELK